MNQANEHTNKHEDDFDREAAEGFDSLGNLEAVDKLKRETDAAFKQQFVSPAVKPKSYVWLAAAVLLLSLGSWLFWWLQPESTSALAVTKVNLSSDSVPSTKEPPQLNSTTLNERQPKQRGAETLNKPSNQSAAPQLKKQEVDLSNQTNTSKEKQLDIVSTSDQAGASASESEIVATASGNVKSIPIDASDNVPVESAPVSNAPKSSLSPPSYPETNNVVTESLAKNQTKEKKASVKKLTADRETMDSVNLSKGLPGKLPMITYCKGEKVLKADIKEQLKSLKLPATYTVALVTDIEGKLKKATIETNESIEQSIRQEAEQKLLQLRCFVAIGSTTSFENAVLRVTIN